MIKLRSNQSGFTIVELMIATSVLSVILLMTTVVMMGIGRLYYKGISQSKVQGVVRNVSDEVSQNLQLNTEQVTNPSLSSNPNIKAYCIGTTRYSYVEGVRIGTQKNNTGPTYYHVLWRDTVSAGSCSQPAVLTNPSLSGGEELISPNSRLLKFAVTGPNGGLPIVSPYIVTLNVAYGEDDLFNDVYNPNPDTVRCKNDIGTQFCATARLSTRVVQRVN